MGLERFSIDSSRAKRRDDYLSFDLVDDGFVLTVGVVVPEWSGFDIGFNCDYKSNALTGEFTFDSEFNLVDSEFKIVNSVKLTKAFNFEEFGFNLFSACDFSYEDKFKVLKLAHLASVLRGNRLINRSVLGKFSPESIVKESMVLFNSKFARWMNENDIGAVYSTGVKRSNSYDIGPDYVNGVYGYAYATSPLRIPVAYFNLVNAFDFLSGDDYVSSDEMVRFDHLNVFEVNNVSDSVLSDYNLDLKRSIHKNNSKEAKKISEDEANPVIIPSRFMNFFSNPKKFTMRNKDYFDSEFDIRDISTSDLIYAFFNKAPGNFVVKKYRLKLLNSKEIDFDALLSALFETGDFNYNWGSVVFCGSRVTIEFNGVVLKRKMSTVKDLNDFLSFCSSSKFDLL